MHSFYLDAIRNFEGYTPQASWDYAQFSNGYGTRAKFAGEVITPAEAERRFQSEISAARSIVEKAAPHLDDGTKAALTSLTYNTGTAWIGSGLGDAARRGDLDAVRDIFQQYNKAGGEVLPGLVSRRAQEALWIGNADAAGAPGDFARTAQALVGDARLTGQGAPSAGVSALQQMIAARPAASTGDEPVRGEAARFGRLAPAERTGHREALASAALAALVDADLKGAEAADLARVAQLKRGSDLARPDKERQNGETRRV